LNRDYLLSVSWKGNYGGGRFGDVMSEHPKYYECKEFNGTVIEELRRRSAAMAQQAV
jgi:hypothetical protein